MSASSHNDFKFHYLNELSKQLVKLRKEGRGDLTIKIDGRDDLIFNSHSFILAASPSGYFRSEDFTKPTLVLNLNIRNLEKDHFEQVLTYLYSGDLELKVQEVIIIHQIARHLRDDVLKKHCIQFMEANFKIDYSYEYWMYGIDNGLTSLERAFFGWINENFVLFCNKYHRILDFEKFDRILSRLNDSVRHEDRYSKISDWYKYNPSDRGFFLNNLLDRINLEMIEEDFINSVILRDSGVCRNSNMCERIKEQYK